MTCDKQIYRRRLLAREGQLRTFKNTKAGFLTSGMNQLQLRHSAGLAPASTFKPLHPGKRVTLVDIYF